MTSPTPFASQIRSIDDLFGPAGKLEAVLNTGRDAAAYTAIVCHPHPLHGGTMHTKAVYHAMKAFSHFGLPTLRFNFRGVGLSEGEFDNADGEQNDVRAGLSWLEHNFKKPTLLAASRSAPTPVCERPAATCGSRGSSASGFPSAPPAATTSTASCQSVSCPSS